MISLKPIESTKDERFNFDIFVVWSVLTAGGWVVVAWSRKSCLGPAEIVSFVCVVLFKDEGRRVSPRFHIFFLMLIKRMKKQGEFNISLCDPRRGKIPLKIDCVL